MSIVLSILFFSGTLNAQELEIGDIFIKRCYTCHDGTNSAPYIFNNYTSIAKRIEMIEYVLEKDIMPLWLADDEYNAFKNTRYLPELEKKKILKWISKGAPQNEFEITKSIENEKLSEMSPDTIICLSKAHILSNLETEEFKLYAFPFITDQDYYIKSYGIDLFDRTAVHHSLLMVNSGENDIKYSDFQDESDLGEPFDGKRPFEILGGYLPGMQRIDYGQNIGFLLPQSSVLYTFNHYPILTSESLDSTCLELFLHEEEPKKVIKNMVLDIEDSNEWMGELILPENQKLKLHVTFPVLRDMTAVSVIPHMHYRGKYFESYVTVGKEDKIPLIKIPDWNFEIQEEYIFENEIDIPRGATVHIEALFDNTERNLYNPVIPPVDVYFNDESLDEMLQMFLRYY